MPATVRPKLLDVGFAGVFSHFQAAQDFQVDFDTASDFASQQGLLFEEAITCVMRLQRRVEDYFKGAFFRLNWKASAVTGANIKACFEKLLKVGVSTYVCLAWD